MQNHTASAKLTALPCRLLRRGLPSKCISLLAVCMVMAMVALTFTGQWGGQQHLPQQWTDDIPAVPTAIHPNPETGAKSPALPAVMAPQPAIKPRRQCTTADPHTNIVFIKVHKSGSSTMSNMLARFALNHDLNIALPEQKPVGDVFHCFGPFWEYRVLPLAEGQIYHVLFNHMIYNRSALNNVMPKNTFYVAIMRQPVKRFLSGIYYFQNLRPPARNNTDNASFKRFISEPSKGKVERNFRLYNSVAWNTGLPLAEQQKEQSVKRHLQRLDEELDLMMVMEHFIESLVLLKRRACLSLRDVVFVTINTRKTYNVHAITEEDLQQLRDWQMADHMAYDFFLAKFWRMVRQEGDGFLQEVDHLRTVTEKVGRYCGSQSPKWDVLVIHQSPWNEEFSLNERDCKLMTSDERELQKLLLTRAKERRDRAGYRETRTHIPQWKSDC